MDAFVVWLYSVAAFVQESIPGKQKTVSVENSKFLIANS